jgi:chromosome segregation ATPase
VQDHDSQKRQLKQDFHRAQTNVDTIEAELSDATPDAGQIEQFQEALEEVQREKEFQEGQFEDITIRKDKLNANVRTHKNALDEATQRLAELKAEADMAQAKVDKLSAKRVVALRNKNTALEAVAAAEANKAVWEKNRQEQLVVVEENTSEAEKISARVEVPHGQDEDSLIRKLRTLQVEIAASEKELGGSEKELVEKALSARQLHQAKGIELAGTRTLIKVSWEAHALRPWLTIF